MSSSRNRKAKQIKGIIQALKGNASELRNLRPLQPPYIIALCNGISYEYGTDKLANPLPHQPVIIVHIDELTNPSDYKVKPEP